MSNNFKTEEKEKSYDQFIKEFERARFNPIYFLEAFWSKVNSDSNIELSDEEKQKLFDKYKGIPCFKNIEQLSQHQEREKKLKEQGRKDWEIQ